MIERLLTRTAVFVVLEREGKIFLLRRANTGWADGYLTVPSGHVDKGDTPLEAAVKEVKEEAGVDVKFSDLAFIHVDYIRDEYVNFYFRAITWNGEPTVGEPRLASESKWCLIDDLPTDIVPQLTNMLKHYKQNSFYSELESAL